MINTSEFIKLKIMEIMTRHRGKIRAITRDLLREEVNRALRTACRPELCFDAHDDRAFRKLYTTLPLAAGEAGLFIPTTRGEVEEFEQYIFSKIPGNQASLRVRRIVATWPELARKDVATQGELGL